MTREQHKRARQRRQTHRERKRNVAAKIINRDPWAGYRVMHDLFRYRFDGSARFAAPMRGSVRSYSGLP